MRLLKASILALSFAAVHAAAMARHDDEAKTPTVVVSAEGAVDVMPDEAQIRFSVNTQRKKVFPAAEENAKNVAAVLAALEKAGVQKSELSTIGFTIQPTIDYSSMASVTGYEVRNTVLIKTDRIDAAGAIIDAAAQTGAVSVVQIAFGLKDNRTLRDQALRQAVANARADASVIADASGGTLGPVRRIITSSNGRQPIYNPDVIAGSTLYRMADRSAAPDLMPGDLTITASVTIEYELTPKAP